MCEVQRLRAVISTIDDNLRAAAGRRAASARPATSPPRAAGEPGGGRGRSQSRYWTEMEHRRFLDAVSW
jgi:hypothetical protein